MINARKAKIRAIKYKSKIVDVNFFQVKQLKKLINISVNKAIKCGKFQTTVSLPENLNEATFEYLKSILMSKCFFCSISYKGVAKILVVEWE